MATSSENMDKVLLLREACEFSQSHQMTHVPVAPMRVLEVLDILTAQNHEAVKIAEHMAAEAQKLQGYLEKAPDASEVNALKNDLDFLRGENARLIDENQRCAQELAKAGLEPTPDLSPGPISAYRPDFSNTSNDGEPSPVSSDTITTSDEHALEESDEEEAR